MYDAQVKVGLSFRIVDSSFECSITGEQECPIFVDKMEVRSTKIRVDKFRERNPIDRRIEQETNNNKEQERPHRGEEKEQRRSP